MTDSDRPAAPEARPRRLFWRLAILMVGVLMLGDVIVIFLMSRDPIPDHADQEIAERFFDGLVVGNGSVDPDDAEGRSGYAVAWSLVSSGFEARTGFEDFVEEQEALVQEFGFLDMPKKLEREWGDFRKRTLEYRLTFSGTRGRPRAALCRITLVLDDSSYRVDSFRVTAEDENR